MICGQTVKEMLGIPKVVRISFCQPTCRQAENTTVQMIKARMMPTTIVRVRPLRVGIPKYAHKAWAPAPMP